MNVLVPEIPAGSWQAQLSAVSRRVTRQPFDPMVIDFIDAVSRTLLMDRSTRGIAELMVVAHWMRKAHLLEIKAEYESKREGHVRLPRGLAVHFAPANVDSIFMYSWFISLLMGNSNIVRISTRRGEAVVRLLCAVNKVLDQAEFSVLQNANMVMSYEHDDEVTERICRCCDIRVLWGGDRTIAALRRIPFPPLATEVAFADRFSLTALNASAVLGATCDELNGLAARFFSDAFGFDQLACASPKLVLWIGSSNDVVQAKERFWPALQKHVRERGVKYPSVVGISRLTAICSYAAGGVVDGFTGSATELPTRAHLRNNGAEFRDGHCGGGLFLEAEFETLNDVLNILSSKDQTLCFFGFGRRELKNLAAKLPARSIDRIVPVGQALNFSTTWDGIDLLDAFSRDVAVGDDLKPYRCASRAQQRSNEAIV